MKIILSPQRIDNAKIILSVAGEKIAINGDEFDFSALPDGAILPHAAINCQWIAGDVQRIDGVLHVPLILPLAADAGEVARFPEPILVASDGPVELPE